jgi:hypothetical protein
VDQKTKTRLSKEADLNDNAPEQNARITIKVEDPPFIIDTHRIKILEIVPINYFQYAACVSRARLAQARDGVEDQWKKYISRERMKAQLRAIDHAGAQAELDDNAILSLPRKYAASVLIGCYSHNSKPGKVLVKGDGATSPVLYQLGTPIMVKRKDGTDQPITELEFSARTYGDIEDVLSETTIAAQTCALISSCAKPIGSEIPLQLLPSWAAEQITVPDGEKIADEVLKNFLLAAE